MHEILNCWLNNMAEKSEQSTGSGENTDPSLNILTVANWLNVDHFLKPLQPLTSTSATGNMVILFKQKELESIALTNRERQFHRLIENPARPFD